MGQGINRCPKCGRGGKKMAEEPVKRLFGFVIRVKKTFACTNRECDQEPWEVTG